MIFVVAAILLGGLAMFAISLPYGLLVALLFASCGGSTAGLIAAVILAELREDEAAQTETETRARNAEQTRAHIATRLQLIRGQRAA